MSDHDLVVRGGTIVDGTGRPAAVGDVAVRDGHIAEVGRVAGRGATEIDATDRCVTPGFFDLHTHLDVQLFFDRTLMVSPWHGVTTVNMGNCGLGIAPTRQEHRELMLRNLQHVEGMDYATTSTGMGEDWGFETFPQFLDAVERRHLAINTVAQIGHVALKTYVMGEEAAERVASDDERRAMKALVSEALAAGAFGFSTDQSTSHFGEGGRPIASRITTTDELRDLVATLDEVDSAIFTVGWPAEQLGADPIMSKELLEELVLRHRHVHFHARNPNVLGASSFHRERIAFHESLRARGGQNHMQFCCLPMQFEASMLDPFMPFVDFPPQLTKAVDACRALFAPVLSATAAERLGLYRGDRFRDQLRQATSDPSWGRVFDLWTFSVVPGHPELELRPVAEVARERGQHPTDLLLDLQLAASEPVLFNMGFFNFDEDEVGAVLQHPLVVPGNSDAGAHVQQMLDARFPTYLLQKFVRERGDLALEVAVRKLTSDSATSLGITDRGVLAPGAWADIVVLDPETVAPGPLERRFDFPAGGNHLVSEPVGIDHVIVNGTPVRSFNRDLLDAEQPMPGRLVRNPGGRS